MSEIVLYTFLKYIIGGTVDRKRWPYFGGNRQVLLYILAENRQSEFKVKNYNTHTLIESMNSAALALSSLLHSLPFHCM